MPEVHGLDTAVRHARRETLGAGSLEIVIRVAHECARRFAGVSAHEVRLRMLLRCLLRA
jgi:hypothetical protein